jgi:flagellar FliJ protein
MKFKFHLEKVLNHKKILEDQAKKDFGEMSKKLRDQEDYLLNLQSDLKAAYEYKFHVQKTGGNIAGYLEFFHNYYLTQKKMIENQEKIIAGLTKIVEEKRQFLVQAAREKKTFTMLKDKKIIEFKKEVNKREQKRIDEMNIIRQELREKI